MVKKILQPWGTKNHKYFNADELIEGISQIWFQVTIPLATKVSHARVTENVERSLFPLHKNRC
jgi:hypothetical protein